MSKNNLIWNIKLVFFFTFAYWQFFFEPLLFLTEINWALISVIFIIKLHTIVYLELEQKVVYEALWVSKSQATHDKCNDWHDMDIKSLNTLVCLVVLFVSFI